MSEETSQDAAAAAFVQALAVQVVGGHPDDVEVAALVAGLAAVAGGNEEPPAPDPEPAQWANRARRLGTSPTTRSPDQWRWSLHS